MFYFSIELENNSTPHNTPDIEKQTIFLSIWFVVLCYFFIIMMTYKKIVMIIHNLFLYLNTKPISRLSFMALFLNIQNHTNSAKLVII